MVMTDAGEKSVKVNTWKNIDVEVEVDVDIDAILAECASRASEAAPDYWRRWIGSIDVLTRILAASSEDVINQVPSDIREKVHKRLTDQAARWAVPVQVGGL